MSVFLCRAWNSSEVTMGRATNMFCCWKSRAEVSDGSYYIHRSTACADKIFPSPLIIGDCQWWGSSRGAQRDQVLPTHYFLALPSKPSLALGNFNTHQLLNRHLATASLVPRSPCSSLLVASPHPYSSRAEVNDWKCWAVNQSNVESYFC